MSYTRPLFQWGIRAEVRFQIWELWVRLKHMFGKHTYVDIEVWVTGEAPTIVGGLCWRCPERT